MEGWQQQHLLETQFFGGMAERVAHGHEERRPVQQVGGRVAHKRGGDGGCAFGRG